MDRQTMVHPHTGVLRRSAKGLLVSAITQMTLKCIILSERNRLKVYKVYTPFPLYSGKGKTVAKEVVARGEGEKG